MLDENGAWTQYAKVTESTKIFDYDRWEPGYTAVAKFKIVNEGSLALKYQLTADVYGEVVGKTKDGEDIILSKYLKYGVTEKLEILKNRKAAADVATNSFGSFKFKADYLEEDAETEVGMVITMPTSVGNEANHNGTDIPSIEFGINLLASQYIYEEDSFGDDYDYSAFIQVTPENFEQVLANLTDGAQLYLLPGTYKVSANDQLKIMNDNVMIVGSGVNSTIIDAEDKTCSGQAALLIDGDNVTLKNLTVKTSSANGNVVAIKYANFRPTPRIIRGGLIENVVVYGGAGHGINLHGVNNVTVKAADVRSYGKCAIACAMATNVTVSGSKTVADGWADLGIMYGNSDAYATPSNVAIKADNQFGNGTVYTERPASASGGADTLTFENPATWAKTVNGDKTIYLAAVASIGDVGYATLQDAINHAVAGETVKLNSDVQATIPNCFGSANTAAISIEKSIIFDGNNKTISVDLNNWDKYNGRKTGNVLSIGVGDAALNTGIDKNVNVTVKNLTIVGSTNDMKSGITVYQATSAGATTKATLENVKISDCGAASIQVNGADLTVTGTDSDIAKGAWNYAIGVDKGGNLTVENGTIEIIQVTTGTCQINGGTVAVASEDNLNATIGFVNPDSTDVTIELANDIAVSKQVTIKKAITFDGKNHTISGAEDYSIPAHASDPQALQQFLKIKGNIWNLSNNHILDYGKEGLEDTFNWRNETAVRCLVPE